MKKSDSIVELSKAMSEFQKEVKQPFKDKSNPSARWRRVKGYEGIYEISFSGEVKSIARERHCGHKGSRPQMMKERILTQSVDRLGYTRVKLSKNGRSDLKYLHRLIAEAFIENDQNYKEVNHIDGDKSNNSVSNLEWTTRSANMKHAFSLGLKNPVTGERNNKSKLTEREVREIRKLFNHDKYTQAKLSEIYNVSIANINYIVNNKTWKEIYK